jgi:hypothetical protein
MKVTYKKMIKLVMSIVLCSVLVFSINGKAFAAGPKRAPVTHLSLTFSGGQAHGSGSVISANQSINATLTLKWGSTVIGSVSGSGTSVVSLSDDWGVESGKTYTLYLSGTIGGVPFEASPVTRTAP